MSVLRRKDLIGRAAPVFLAELRRLLASCEIVAGFVNAKRNTRLIQGDIDLLADPGAFAGGERGQNANATVHATTEIRDGDRQTVRAFILVSSDRSEAGNRLAD